MSGIWTRTLPALVSATLLAFLALPTLSGCGGDDQEEAAAQQQHGQQQAARQPGQGSGGQQGQRPAGQQGHRPGGPGGDQTAVPVAVDATTTGDIASHYQATATLEAEKQAEVLARATGVVGELHAEEGDLVAAGAPLLTIDNDEYRFRLEQAAANTVNLRARFDRLDQMRAEELATEEEFQAARADLAGAEADEGLARLNLSYTTVRAPFAGRVTGRLVDPGQNVSAGNALFVMADFDPLLARVHVPSREFHRLQRDQSVDLVLDSNGTRMRGRIKLISPVIDPASGTIKITVEVSEYPQGTRPGDFAQVSIVTEMRRDVVLVPRGAVLTDKGETVAYTLVPGEHGPTAERRIVEVGFTDDDHAQILSGLEAGDRVVVKGQRSLKHGQAVKVLEGPGDGQGRGQGQGQGQGQGRRQRAEG
ncbi:MAG: efflux RND transporter periplasmic adaptor subunit [bacterium]|nr:efflux RND transporter periplasmic adaptor subunit [bacterium]